MDDQTLADLVQCACLAADRAIFAPENSGITPAEMTRRQLRSALEALIANGLITVTDKNVWPEYFFPDPPYHLHHPEDQS